MSEPVHLGTAWRRRSLRRRLLRRIVAAMAAPALGGSWRTAAAQQTGTTARGDSPTSSDYDRERRWADEVIPGLVVGEPAWIEQANGHRFLALYTKVQASRGAVVIAHGRGTNPDWGLNGVLRVALADAGYTTLSIQMPVLDAGGKLEAYLHLFDEAKERFALACAFLEGHGHPRIGIVSHSLGARMANEFLIGHPPPAVKVWVSIGIINGMQNMQWVEVPVLDLFGEKDWNGVLNGAPERALLIRSIKGSRQVMVPGADHFFEGREDALVSEVRSFLDANLAER